MKRETIVKIFRLPAPNPISSCKLGTVVESASESEADGSILSWLGHKSVDNTWVKGDRGLQPQASKFMHGMHSAGFTAQPHLKLLRQVTKGTKSCSCGTAGSSWNWVCMEIVCHGLDP